MQNFDFSRADIVKSVLFINIKNEKKTLHHAGTVTA